MKISPEEYGFTIGEMKHGAGNQITDVPGVKVGQATLDHENVHTGVTVILPCEGSVYRKKPVAASYVLNGYGKTAGTIQIDELGVIESPIALTNTLNVGKVMDALCEYTITSENAAGRAVTTFNAVVGETNDSHINDIVQRAVSTADVLQAIASASKDFEEGAVGAGRGTVCMGLKGGIGSSSRVLRFARKEYTVGALVQSNFGRMEDLMICGQPYGRQIQEKIRTAENEDKGSIMIVIGTDLPLTERQLKRVLKRAAAGLIRTGSYLGHGSGDIILGFTNGNCIPDSYGQKFLDMQVFPETKINDVFRAAAECVEEAILCSLLNADACRGRNGETYHSLREFLKKAE